MDKDTLRTDFCTLRECISPKDIAAASSTLCQRLAPWLIKQADDQASILTYLAFRNEPDLSLLRDLLPDAHWIVPRIEAAHRLILHPYDPKRLTRHRFGMLEPDPDLPVVDPASLDVALIPGVAFDRRGGRLGFGGGYYDRFLPTTPAIRVGIAFETCLADDLPCDEHDQLVNWIATPSEIIPCWSTRCKPS